MSCRHKKRKLKVKMTESTGDYAQAMKPSERTQVEYDKRRARRIKIGRDTQATMMPGKLLNKLASLSLIVLSLLSLFTFYHNQQPALLAHAARTTTTPNVLDQPHLLWQLQQQPRWQPHRGGSAADTSVNITTSQATPIRSHQQVAGASTLRPTISNNSNRQQVVESTTLRPTPTSLATLSTSTLDSLSGSGGDSDIVTAESGDDPADSPSSSSAAEDASEPAEEPDSLDRRDDHESAGSETTSGDEAQPEDSATPTFEGIHVRPSRESAPLTTTTTQATTTPRADMTQPGNTILRGNAQSSANQRPSPTFTTTASTPMVLRRQQVAAVIATTTQPPVSRQTMSAFDVNVGADRMLIKPAATNNDDFNARLFSSAPTPLADSSGRGTTGPPQTQPQRSTFANFLSRSPASQQITARPTTTTTSTTMTPAPPEDDDSSASDSGGTAPMGHELANESVTHHQHVPMVASPEEQRERLMYPPLSGGGGRSRDSSTGSQQDHQHQAHQQHHHHELAVASICYTPMSLFFVIVVTIAITLAVCFCTLHLVRYLKRNHQFDLVANTKHFDHKHLSGASSSAGYLLQSGAGSGSSASMSATAYSHHRTSGGALSPYSPLGGHASSATRLGTCMLHPFQRDDQCNKCLATSSCGPLAQTSVSSEPGGGGGGGGGTYAFRNPYFADELNMQHQHQPRQSPDNVRPSESRHGDPAAMPPLGVELDGEHMHFIESHIANLHNRQVTSSVKELSSLNGDDHHQHLVAVAPQVVDLTSDEQRARVRAHPQQGDLVAVDLSGHDIIGLGFDVCGGNGPRDQGIFVSSISAHGPASASGLIHAGDRIKCLNVTFERSMTLQDARDILNCAAPYKMRLLLEKRMAGLNELQRMPGAAHSRLGESGAAARSRASRMLPTSASNKNNALETTRDYLKQLTGKLMGTHGGDNGSENEGNESQRRLNVASERTAGCGSLMSRPVAAAGDSATAAAAPIGSRAARQQMQRLEPAHTAAAINETISDSGELSKSFP